MSKLYSEDHEYEIERIQGTDQYAVKEDGAFWTNEDNTVQLMENSEVFNDVLLIALEERYGYDTNKNADVVSYEDFLKEMQEQNVTLSAADIQIVTEQLNAPAYTEEQVQDFLKGQIEKLCDENGMQSLYPARDESIQPETVMQQFEKYQKDSDGRETFKQYLEDYFWEENAADSMYELLSDIKSNAISENLLLADALNQYFDKADSIAEVLEEAGYNGISFEIADFLQSDYKLDITLATKEELNLDNSSIIDTYCNDGSDVGSYVISHFDKEIDNAATYLIHQQGHEVQEVFSEITGEASAEGFVKSFAEEAYECGSGSTTEVTFNVKASGQELLDVLETIAKKDVEKNLEFSENSTVGLSDSCFGIELEIPAIVPTDMISSVEINTSANAAYLEYGGYVSTTNEQPELVHEDISVMKEAFLAKNEKQKEQAEIEYDD